jgi:hypothetical protein
MRLAVVALVLLGAVSCGGPDSVSAGDLQNCVREHLPPNSVDNVLVSSEQGVTSINYFHRGSEVDVSVFASAEDAVAAEKAEARLGDAHDRRIKNVLYSGGGAIQSAVVRCAQ